MKSRVAAGLLGALLAAGCGSSELTGSFPDECIDSSCGAETPVVDTVAGFELPDDAMLPAPEAVAVDGQVLPPTTDDVEPAEDQEILLPSDLRDDDELRISVLRDSITIGLDLGRVEYLDEMEITLHDLGLAEAYALSIDVDDAGLAQELVECPFVENLGNGFDSNGKHCDYLTEVAKVEVYSELVNSLDESPLPESIAGTEYAEEADFWYEQGAISGVEEGRVQVRFDMKDRELCNTEPTPIESSFDKGVQVGRQLFADQYNDYLASRGFTADYPEMSDPIEVCNANSVFLEPARQSSIHAIERTVTAEPLCDGYEPPTQEMSMHYAQAEIDYTRGVRAGIDDEFALAVVRTFVVIPCVVADPLVVDLDGDGIELTNIVDGVNFDMRADGSRQAVAWVASDDAFLALDRNNNGKIDSGAELFGNTERDYADGFEDLAALDSNADRLITPQDPQFASLLVWQDANSDGFSTPEELSPLSSLGVNRIPVDSRESLMTSGGNLIPEVATMSGDGGHYLLGDALLQTAPYPRLSRADQ